MRTRKTDNNQPKMIVIIVLSVIVIVSVIVAVFMNLTGKRKMPADSESQNTTDSIVVTENTEDKEKLEADINTLIRQYRAAFASADTDAIARIYHTDDVKTKDTIKATAQIITGYQNTVCYIRKGLDDNSKVVFIYDDLKLADIDTLVPNLSYVYARRDDTGAWYIDPGTYDEASMSYVLDKEIRSYIDDLSSDSEISALVDSVNKKFAEACKNNEALKAFMDKLTSAAALKNGETGGSESFNTPDTADTSADTSAADSETGESQTDTGAPAV